MRLPLRYLPLPLMFLLVSVGVFGAEPASRPRRPNIIFIMTDDHANSAISAYGSKLIQTPNIDRLAHEGLRFDNAFCTNSICGPSRAVILTGKYSHVNGFMMNETNTFDGRQMTFPKLFQAAGYQTAVIGKWHLESDPTGFDYWNILIGQGQYFDAPFNCMGTTTVHPGYVTDVTSQMTIDWLRHRPNPDQPFVLLTQHKAPHANFHPPPRYEHTFDAVTFPEPPTLFDDYATRSPAARTNNMRIDPHLALQFVSNGADRLQVPAGLEGRDRTRWLYQFYLRNYLGCVLAVDDAVGDLLATLDELGLTENTIVVYTSDQGFYLGEHGWYDKRFMYEESLRNPLIVRYPPSIAPGGVEKRMVLNLDYAQTFLDYAGITAPADMQGRSLRPLLDGKAVADWRQSIYYHYYEYPGWHYVPRHYGVRTERYKLIHFYHDIDAWELYDLQADPHELNNLYGEAAYAGVQSELQSELKRLQDQYGDSPELARETIQRYPHGSRPPWGRAENLPEWRARKGGSPRP
jgi:arylsulfatase A-like enzyme